MNTAVPSIPLESHRKRLVLIGVPELPTRNELTDTQFDVMMEEGYTQAITGQGLPVEKSFARIRAGI